MEVNLHDEHVISMVLEYLHAKNLLDSALALERETGILVDADSSMPEHSRYLRNLCLNGEWENVKFYLEPFTELHASDAKRLEFLVLRQKFVEVLHAMNQNKCCSSEDKEALLTIMSEIRPLCSDEEMLQIRALTVNKKFNDSGTISVSRLQCFQDILKTLGPFFDHCEPVTQDADRAYTTSGFTRLESVVTDSLFLEACCKRCRDKALQVHNDSTLPTLSSSTLDYRGTDPSYNAAVLFWILSLKQTDIYRQPYQVEKVKVTTEKIARPENAFKNSPSARTSRASPNATSRNYSEHHILQPTAARSLQISNNAKTSPSNPTLSESGPMSFSDFGRNVNNNSNVNPTAGVTVHQSPGDASLSLANESDIFAASPLIKLNGWTKENLEQPVETQNSELSTSDVRDFSMTESARTEPETNSPSPNMSDSAVTSQVSDFNVNSSHEQFLSEQRMLKKEKEDLLRQIEEKEREHADIRRRLMEPSSTSPGRTFQKGDVSASTDLENSSVRSSYSQPSSLPFNKLQCVQLEQLEDTHAIRTMSFHPGGQVYAVGSNSKTLRVCSVPREVITYSDVHDGDVDIIKKRSPRPAAVIATANNYHKGSVYCSAWSDDGTLIATGSNDKLVKLSGFNILGKCLDDKPSEPLMHRGIVRDVAFMHESSNRLASAGVDQMVYITDCTQERNIHSLAGHSGQVLGLYSWHREMLASTSEDKTIRLWDIRTPHCVSIIEVGGATPCVATSICVDNGVDYLAMGMDCAKIALYDIRKRAVEVEYKCHTGEIRSVRFNPVYRDLLLSSSYDGSVVVTDVHGLLSEIDPRSSHLHHWKTLTESTQKLIQCRWHPNGDAFAATSVDKTCRLYMKIST